MKIRTGFVSNSSSSSFILSSDKDAKLTIEVSLADIIDKTITSEDDFKDYLTEHCGLDYYIINEGKTFEEALKEESITDVFKNGIDELRNGKVLKVIDASNEDYGIGSYVYNYGLKSNNVFKIIKGE